MHPDQNARKGPYEPIDANRPRYGTAEERRQTLSETLLWGWSALIVVGAAFGIHEILAQGSLSVGLFAAALVAALLIGATEYHIVCNVITSGARRITAYVAAALCLGFLLVFTHVAVVSVLGTPRLAYDAWFRDAARANSEISTRVRSIEFSLEQLIGTQYEPRGEEETVGAVPPAEPEERAFSAVLLRWNDAFTVHSTPLKGATADFPRDSAEDKANDIQTRTAGIVRALARYNTQIGLETTATGFSRYLNTGALVEDTIAQQHLRTIAADLKALAGIQVAELPSDRSAGVNALKRLGNSMGGLIGAGGAKPLMTRDYIGLGTAALALLFVLLLQVNRWRFRIPDLPEPPDSLRAHEHTS